MKKNMAKRFMAATLTCALLLGLLSGCGDGATTKTTAVSKGNTTATGAENGVNYPEKDIVAVCPYGVSSGIYSDATMLTSMVEEYLGTGVGVVDKAGAAGAVGTEYYMTQKSDGYTILICSESISAFLSNETSEITYDDITPVLLLYQKVFGIATAVNSGYNTFDKLVQAARENPGKINVGTTGTGSVHDVLFDFVEAAYDVKFNRVAFDSSGDANTAVMSGEVAATAIGPQTGAISLLEAQSVIPVLMWTSEDIGGVFEGIPVAGEIEALKPYVPYGPFTMVALKADTDPQIVQTLYEAFNKVYESQDYQEYLDSVYGIRLGLTGEEATTWLKDNQAKLMWALYDTGASTVNPEDHGISRPE